MYRMTVQKHSRKFALNAADSVLSQFTFDTFVASIMIIAVIVLALRIEAQSDTWWLLRSGQYIVETHHIPTVEPFSSTVNGGYWPNHEWLVEVLFFGLYSAGGMPLLVTGCALIIVAVWIAIYQSCSGPGRFRALVILPALSVSSLNVSLRPYLFTIVLLAATILLLPKYRLHFLYPILFLLWANLHGGVAFGAVVLAIACFVALLVDRKRLVHWLVISALSAAATFINPLGYKLWYLVVESMRNPVLFVTDEWKPPQLSHPGSYMFFALVTAYVLIILKHRHRWRGHTDWTLILCSAVFAVLAFRGWRNMASFAVIAPLLLSRHFEDRPILTLRSPRGAYLHGLALGLAAVSGLLFVGSTWADGRMGPALSPKIVHAVRACDGFLFNTYYEGGFLLWSVPERPVFIDNRQDPFPPELISRTVNAEQTGEYHDLFARYGVACSFQRVNTALYKALTRDGWHEVGRDAQYAVLRQPK